MSWCIFRPGDDRLAKLLDKNSKLGTDESARLGTERASRWHAYRQFQASATLGYGQTVFEHARTALLNWRLHELSGIQTLADGDLRVGTTIAMSLPLPIGWMDAACVVTAVVDQPHTFEFTYRTLLTHPEEGEETFALRSGSSGAVLFEIRAHSRLRYKTLAWASPLARHLQNRATARYLSAMQTAVATAREYDDQISGRKPN